MSNNVGEGLALEQAISDPKQVVAEVCRLFEEHRCMEAVDRHFSPDYIEHNPQIPGGNLEGFKDLLVREGLDVPTGRPLEITVLQMIAEGPDVVVYMKAVEPGKPPLMIMEIYRVIDGKVVEHWDVMQAEPA